ncbi:hypothetical protein [Acinetobacter sp. MD2(2019)]|uniref:hypothetical protein n=1 Tax=Acinetobacter sp. MD2(2019) TaxID=2605273 RepID=UPI002D1E4D65|nr:hypothetical protein [Acinetobacter sp. MD2(2019)]MEB3755098.1 hypothetical protein [Acinetobacter sp. MD2(2019)]
MNDNIVPYVPIAERVQATNPKSQLLCQQFFNMVDHLVKAQITFNHDTTLGCLSICPDQINDLLSELAKNEQINRKIDIEILKLSLNDLIYPKFIGENTVTSPIWNKTEVKVWQFKLNQIVSEKPMNNQDNAELNLDMAISSIRLWRASLELGGDNCDVVYQKNDLIYKLLDLEQKLESLQILID